eukprot:1408612-Amphidinium_carterae.1
MHVQKQRTVSTKFADGMQNQSYMCYRNLCRLWCLCGVVQQNQQPAVIHLRLAKLGDSLRGRPAHLNGDCEVLSAMKIE